MSKPTPEQLKKTLGACFTRTPTPNYPPIPLGYKLIWPAKGKPPIRRDGDMYWDEEFTVLAWHTTTLSGSRIRQRASPSHYIRRIKRKPSPKPRKRRG